MGSGEVRWREYNGMTITEAGEQILRGPYHDCLRCSGTGLAISGHTRSTCMICMGSGKLVRKSYKRACERLGMPIPAEPVAWWHEDPSYGADP